jgi:hypothetical protein
MQRKVFYPVLALIACIVPLFVHSISTHPGFVIFSILWPDGVLMAARPADTSNIRQGSTEYMYSFNNTRGVFSDGIAAGEVLETPGP